MAAASVTGEQDSCATVTASPIHARQRGEPLGARPRLSIRAVDMSRAAALAAGSSARQSFSQAKQLRALTPLWTASMSVPVFAEGDLDQRRSEAAMPCAA